MTWAARRVIPCCHGEQLMGQILPVMPCSVPHHYTLGTVGREQSGFIAISTRNKPWLDWPRQTLACPPTCHEGQGSWGQAKCWLSSAESVPFPTQTRLYFSNTQLRPGLADALHWWCQDFLLGLASSIWMGVIFSGRQPDAWQGLPCRQDATPQPWLRAPFSIASESTLQPQRQKRDEPVVRKGAGPTPNCSADEDKKCGHSICCREPKSIK